MCHEFTLSLLFLVHLFLLISAKSQLPRGKQQKLRSAACAGDMWLLQVNQSEAKSLGFLPAGDAIDSNRVQTLKEKAYGTLQFFLHSDQWKAAMFRGSYYFSGKGFQKAGLELPGARVGGLKTLFCCSKIFQTGPRSPSPFRVSHGHTSW